MDSILDASPSTFVGLYESTNHLMDRLFDEDPELALALCYERIAAFAKKSFPQNGLTRDVTGNPSLRRIHGKLNIANVDAGNLQKLFSASPEIYTYLGKPSFHISHPFNNDFNVHTTETLVDFCKGNELEFIVSPNTWLDTGKRLRLTIFRPEVLDLFNSQFEDSSK